jgi:hypothetical protein
VLYRCSPAASRGFGLLVIKKEQCGFGGVVTSISEVEVARLTG